MVTRAAPTNLAADARRIYSEQIERALPAVAKAIVAAARILLDKPAEYALKQQRRDLLQALMHGAEGWQRAIAGGLRHALLHGVSASRVGELVQPPSGAGMAPLTLVDNDTIEREILTSRLSLAIMDRASWEFADLRSRVAALERRAELEPNDLLRAHVLAFIAVDAWRTSGFSLEAWRDLQQPLQEEFAAVAEEAYHEANRWLVGHGVMPEVDLRPFIRRSRRRRPPRLPGRSVRSRRRRARRPRASPARAVPARRVVAATGTTIWAPAAGWARKPA